MRVSAPGKTILMGEHAAVFGRPALVAAIDRRLTAEVRRIPAAEAVLDLPEIGVREAVPWDVLRRLTDTSRAAWERFHEAPSPETFQALSNDDPAHLVKLAVGEAIAGLDDDGLTTSGLEFRLTSRIPFGAGCGSSAAAAVAVVAACRLALDTAWDPDELHRLSLEVERRQHGTPSGVDNAAVIRGGLLRVGKKAGSLSIEEIHPRPALLDAFRLFHTGSPAEATGDVVTAVRPRLEGFPQRLDRMEEATDVLYRALLDDAPASAAVGEAVRSFEANLEEIGVVPDAIRETVRQVEAHGGAAKISGAGALSGDGAGALLVFHPDPGEIAGWSFLDAFEDLGVRLGAPGIRRENGVAPAEFTPSSGFPQKLRKSLRKRTP